MISLVYFVEAPASRTRPDFAAIVGFRRDQVTQVRSISEAEAEAAGHRSAQTVVRVETPGGSFDEFYLRNPLSEVRSILGES